MSMRPSCSNRRPLHLLAELREFSAKMRCHIVSCAEWQERARAFEAGCGGLARELGDGGEAAISAGFDKSRSRFLPLHSIVYRALASLEHGVVNERANVERNDFGTRAPTTVLRAAILRERIRSLQTHVRSAKLVKISLTYHTTYDRNRNGCQ